MRSLYILIICLAFMIAGCGGGGGGDGVSNNAPLISGTPTTYQKEGTYSFTPSATDADSDSLAWSIANKPGWANFDTSTGKLSGTATAGVYKDITITVSDGTDNDSVKFDLSIVTWVLTKTGQTTSYADYDDGYYQKGTDSYFSRSEPVAGEFVVTDNLNGLMWQDDLTAGTTTATGDTAASVCTSLNLSIYGGYTDWRLPDIDEIESLESFGTVPSINPVMVNTALNYYWSSTAYAFNALVAWAVYTESGFIDADSVTSSYNVMCVRGNSNSAGNYERDDTSKTVTDKRTGLIWQDEAVSSTMTWSAAITYCEDKTLGGYSDWRLPNSRELASIVDRSQNHPAISSVFDNTASNHYWSSTTDVSDVGNAWYASFDDGVVRTIGKVGNYYVRCVRGGK